MKSFEINDGALEVVDASPLRKGLPTPSAAELVQSSAGGKMAAMREKASKSNQRFLLMRRPSGAAKLALSHIGVFKALVRLNLAKRAQRATDPGVSLGEIAELAPEVNTSVLASLIKNQAVRRKTTYVGFQGTRVSYYPTDIGLQLAAMAETFGEGVMVQLGGLANGWKGRNTTEPPTIFQCADLLKRGLPLEAA